MSHDETVCWHHFEPNILGTVTVIYQWLFLVPVKGGRWHIIPAIGSIYHLYTTYSPCLLGGYMLPTSHLFMLTRNNHWIYDTSRGWNHHLHEHLDTLLQPHPGCKTWKTLSRFQTNMYYSWFFNGFVLIILHFIFPVISNMIFFQNIVI